MTTEKFGRYEIKSELGRGGMATVFHAYDPRFERDVAIKVLPREFLHDPQFRVRFEREAKTIALLEHPAIVPVYDFGEEEGQPYIVMRFMAGGSLADRLQQGPMSLREVGRIVSRLAPALDVAHNKGVIHRDMKPGNILFDQYGNAYISDFGIARLRQSSGSGGTLTGTAILGTPAYMSPEQVQGDKEIDGRSDLYSFGIILFQMLTGTTPFRSDAPAKVMMMHLLEPVPQVKTLRAEVPAAFDDVTERALAKQPDERYQTANELAAAVETAVFDAAEQGFDSADPAMATRVTPGAERATTPRPRTGPVAARTVVAPGAVDKLQQKTAARPGVKVTAKPAPAPRKSPVMGLVLGGVATMIVLGLVAVVGFFALRPVLFPAASATATVEPTLALASIPTETQEPTSTRASTNTPLPTSTQEPTLTPQPTQAPTLTPLPSDTPAPSNTPVPVVIGPPVIGGADKLALVDKGNNVWIMNLDGSDPRQLTVDGAVKDNVQWSPDGQAVVFISGNCAKIVNIDSGRVDDITCFSAGTPNALNTFEISPDGQQVAISFLGEMYLLPYDLNILKDVDRISTLRANAVCDKISPYSSNTGTAIWVNWVQWSDDMKYLAVDFLGVADNKQADMIDILDVSSCKDGPWRVDQFPATRFTIDGYSESPTIENFTWDGEYLFALTSGKNRNGGFGDLYFYNSDLHKGQKINPLNGTCCYRDPSWSPEGDYLVFVYQDVGLGPNNITQIYLVSYGSLSTGATYTPIPMPDGIFSNKRDKPLPVLRPAK